jgi:type II secretion system protein N
MKGRIDPLVASARSLARRITLPPAVAERLGPLRDRLAPLTANRALVARGGAYVLFFVGALALFTLLRFPVEGMVERGMMEVNRRAAPFRVTVGSVASAPPLGARLVDVALTRRFGVVEDPLLTGAEATVRPAFFSTLIGRPGADVALTLLGGEADVAVRLGGFDAGDPVSLSFDAADIDPEGAAFWRGFPWAKVSGRLSGAGDLTLDPVDATKLVGDLTARLAPGAVTLSAALFPDAPPIAIDEASFSATAAEGKVTIAHGTAKGPEIDATVTGDIALTRNPVFSRLNLRVTARLSGKLKARLSPFLFMLPNGGDGSDIRFTVIGTLARPTVK